MSELNHMNMPPGWDTKADVKTGKSYFFNHITKNVSLDDPRIRLKQIQSEDIPLHNMQEYTTSSGRASPQPSYRSFGHSPAHSQRSYSPTSGSNSIYRSSSPTLGGSHAMYRDYSLSTYNLDDSALKISLLFPTVDESHIRALLIKYHNREALVVSALQVEKHPLCTPGPYTPPPLRLRRPMAPSSIISTPSSSPRPTGGPGIWRASPHSPKMKLRYLKSVFPVADDTLLLDTLSDSENNVVMATEALLKQGFRKKSMQAPPTPPPPRIVLSASEDKEETESLPRMKTLEEKDAMKSRLQTLFPSIPEQVIRLALEVVDYRETMAAHILEVTSKNNGGDKKTENNRVTDQVDASVEIGVEAPSHSSAVTGAPLSSVVIAPPQSSVVIPPPQSSVVIPPPQSSVVIPPPQSSVVIPPPMRPGLLLPPAESKEGKTSLITVCSQTQGKRPKGKGTAKISRGTCTAEDKNYKSSLVSSPQGANPELPMGPQDENILPGYVPWNGPNKDLLFGARISPAGPNRLLLSLKTIFARGPTKGLAKGPRIGLAKGSMYSQPHEPIHCH